MIVYRAGAPEDAQVIAAAYRDSFTETFGHLYQASDLALFFAMNHTEALVCTELEKPDNHYQVAWDGNAVAGFCKLSQHSNMPHELPGHVMEIKQFYLRARYFGQGIADDLMQWCSQSAIQSHADHMVLSVYSENHRAMRFYQRHGFAFWRTTFFMVGNQRDDEFIFARNMRQLGRD